jgi:hypothetical protein
MMSMDEPPFLLDAARVVAYAPLDLGRAPAVFSLVVGGISLGRHNVSRLAIVENLVDETTFLLHCNDRWETLAAEPCRDAPSAQKVADAAYGRALAEWRAFRELTAAEAREIETTRSFLRGLAAEDNGQGA